MTNNAESFILKVFHQWLVDNQVLLLALISEYELHLAESRDDSWANTLPGQGKCSAWDKPEKLSFRDEFGIVSASVLKCMS